MYILYMLSWVSQTIIIVQTHVYENIVHGKSNVQYSFGQERTPSLMRAIVIILGMLMYRPYLSPFLLGSWVSREFGMEQQL